MLSARKFRLVFLTAEIGIVLATAAIGFTQGNQAPPSQKNRPPSASEKVLLAANEWLERYRLLPRAQRNSMETAAVQTAQRRRGALKQLVDEDPERALELSLGAAARVDLPPNVVAQFETQIDGSGDYLEFVSLWRMGSQQEQKHVDIDEGYLRVAGRNFHNPARYGRRMIQHSKENVPVHGIALDDRFAWSALPLRVLDPVEKQRFQVPAKSTAVLIGDLVHILKDPRDLDDLVRSLIARELIPGPILPGFFDPLPSPGTADFLFRRPSLGWTTGSQDLLYVPIDFSDAPAAVIEPTPETLLTLSEVREWVALSSRRRASLVTFIFPGVLRMPRTAADYGRSGGGGTLVADGRSTLAAYDASHGGLGDWLPESWGRIAFVARAGLPLPDGTISAGGIASDSRYMAYWGLYPHFSMTHEVGHTFLFPHAGMHVSRTPVADPIGAGVDFQVAEPWNFMGNVLPARLFDLRCHPAAWDKSYSSWLTDGEVADGTSGGTFRLYAHDNDSFPFDHLMVIRIVADEVREYSLEMRRKWPEEPFLRTGVQLRYVDKRDPTDYQPAFHLLVGRAATPIAEDSPFQAGDVFTDSVRGVRISFGAMSTDGSGFSYADITIERF